AIIGILAAVAIPAYQDYVAKSQLSSALSELASLKITYEVAVNEGNAPSLSSVDDGYIGMTSTTSSNCNFSLLAANGGIACGLKRVGPALIGASLELRRGPDGVWSCSPVGIVTATGSAIPARFLPAGCS
ncbi:hypothetical protein A3758_28305, partial [Oleiphilus sp. HI0118]